MAITQGVKGRVVKYNGDFMPGPGRRQGGLTSPMSVPVLIFKGKVNPNGSIPEPMAMVQADVNGFYEAELKPGMYTAVMQLRNGLYLNHYDANGNWATFKVKKGEVSEWPLTDSSEACF